MRKINHKECINVNFSNGPGIFNERFEYPLTEEQETNNGPIRKVIVSVEASQKGWPGLSVEILKLANIVHVPQVG